jgi:hypothetical protein
MPLTKRFCVSSAITGTGCVDRDSGDEVGVRRAGKAMTRA